MQTLILSIFYFFCASCLFKLKNVQVASVIFVPIAFFLLSKFPESLLENILIFTLFIAIFYRLFLKNKKMLRFAVIEFFLISMISRIAASMILLFFKDGLIDYRWYTFGTSIVDVLVFGLILLLLSYIKSFFIVNNAVKNIRHADMVFSNRINTIILFLTLLFSNSYIKNVSYDWNQLGSLFNIKGLLSFGLLFFIIIIMFLKSFLTLIIYGNLKYRLLNEKASSDPMTGVLSREAGLRKLNKLFKESKVSNKPLTIAYVDINNLKVVNDKFGHSAGDVLIESICNIMKRCLRQTEYVSRIGGDEFLVIFEKSNLALCKKIWNRVELTIEAHNQSKRHEFDLGVSVGFCEFDKAKHKTIHELMAEADSHMYSNKRLTKNAR